ncbi:hypothetical protein QBC39DRAFT_334751 [Podospora conica]|nr:hypothetical protein QBC39DRAFT_334751 [Schizothecium conicum]
MEASSEPARQTKTSWGLKWGLKVGKVTYRLMASLPGLKSWFAPASTQAEAGHKINTSVDSGIFIPYDNIGDAPELPESQAAQPAAVVVITPPANTTPPPATPATPLAIPATPMPAPRQRETDPLFSMALTPRSRQHITEAISNGAFSFPPRNLAQDHEDIQAFSRLPRQTTYPKPVPSTSPPGQQPAPNHPSLLTPWPIYDESLTYYRTLIAQLSSTLTSLTSEATALSATLAETTHDTRMHLQRRDLAPPSPSHNNPPTFIRDLSHFHIAQRRLDELYTELDETRANLAAAVRELEQIQRAQHLAD